jgi:hypothetical protein
MRMGDNDAFERLLEVQEVRYKCRGDVSRAVPYVGSLRSLNQGSCHQLGSNLTYASVQSQTQVSYPKTQSAGPHDPATIH